MNLTDNEKHVILRIFRDEYSDGTLECSPWSWSVANGSHVVAGTLASLKEKQLISIEDHEGQQRNRDMYIVFTDAGKLACVDLLIESIEKLLTKHLEGNQRVKATDTLSGYRKLKEKL